MTSDSLLGVHLHRLLTLKSGQDGEDKRNLSGYLLADIPFQFIKSMGSACIKDLHYHVAFPDILSDAPEWKVRLVGVA